MANKYVWRSFSGKVMATYHAKVKAIPHAFIHGFPLLPKFYN